MCYLLASDCRFIAVYICLILLFILICQLHGTRLKACSKTRVKVFTAERLSKSLPQIFRSVLREGHTLLPSTRSAHVRACGVVGRQQSIHITISPQYRPDISMNNYSEASFCVMCLSTLIPGSCSVSSIQSVALLLVYK